MPRPAAPLAAKRRWQTPLAAPGRPGTLLQQGNGLDRLPERKKRPGIPVPFTTTQEVLAWLEAAGVRWER